MGVANVGYTDDGKIFMTFNVRDGEKEGVVVSTMPLEEARRLIGWLETALEQAPVGGEVVIENERNRTNLN